MSPSKYPSLEPQDTQSQGTHVCGQMMSVHVRFTAPFLLKPRTGRTGRTGRRIRRIHHRIRRFRRLHAIWGIEGIQHLAEGEAVAGEQLRDLRDLRGTKMKVSCRNVTQSCQDQVWGRFNRRTFFDEIDMSCSPYKTPFSCSHGHKGLHHLTQSHIHSHPLFCVSVMMFLFDLKGIH